MSETFPLMISARPGFFGRVNWAIVAPTVIVGLLIAYLAQTGGYHFLYDPSNGAVAVSSGTQYYLDIIGGYIMYLEFYFIYMTCGKRSNWLPFIGAVAFTYLVLDSPVFDLVYGYFDDIGNLFDPTAVTDLTTPDTSSFFLRWAGVSFSIGLREELFKAIPALALGFSYLLLKDKSRASLGVREPLDGILVCCACAAALSINETYKTYIYLSNSDVQAIVNAIFGKSLNLHFTPLDITDPVQHFLMLVVAQMSEAHAFSVLLPRLLSNLTGHLAWSGIFGYFIGLFVLNPRRNWIGLPIGWVTAALLHGYWDAAHSEANAIICALISITGLMAVIIKGRQLSPTRQDNFGSTVLTPTVKTPSPAKPAAPTVLNAKLPPRLSLKIGDRGFALVAGAELKETDVVGLSASAADGRIAVVEANPKDESSLGLRNLSAQNWQATLPGGQKIEIPRGRAVLLVAATQIQFGISQAQVLSE